MGLEVKYVNGWEFIKKGKSFYFNEKANKIIDAIIRPSLSAEISCSTHSSDSDNSDSENELSNYNNRTTNNVDNVLNTVRALDYYLDTVNTLFDAESEIESDSDEDIPISMYENDTVVEGPDILHQNNELNNEVIEELEEDSINSEVDTESAPINS